MNPRSLKSAQEYKRRRAVKVDPMQRSYNREYVGGFLFLLIFFIFLFIVLLHFQANMCAESDVIGVERTPNHL